MSQPTTRAIAAGQYAGPSFEEQGIGVDEALFALGLVDESFYDGLCPAEPATVDALEVQWGTPLPAPYRCFLERAGASLGKLQICDWRTAWDFRATAICELLEASPDAVTRSWRAAGLLPMANQGLTTELGYERDSHLLLDVQSGELVSDDSNRDSYEGLAGFVLEWGLRLLEPRMARALPRARMWSTGALLGARIQQVHRLAASMVVDEGSSYVGRWVGIYRFHDSGIILKLRSAEEMSVEARHRARRDPERTQAAAFLRAAREAGWIRSS